MGILDTIIGGGVVTAAEVIARNYESKYLSLAISISHNAYNRGLRRRDCPLSIDVHIGFVIVKKSPQ